MSVFERERFDPFPQHLEAILNEIAEAASPTYDRSIYNIQSPDNFFDESNIGYTKQVIPSRFRSFLTSSSGLNDANAQPDSVGQEERAWHEEKQQSQQPKQQALNGHKSHYFQEINEKTDPNQLQQQKPSLKSFDNNEDFMQSFDLK